MKASMLAYRGLEPKPAPFIAQTLTASLEFCPILFNLCFSSQRPVLGLLLG